MNIIHYYLFTRFYTRLTKEQEKADIPNLVVSISLISSTIVINSTLRIIIYFEKKITNQILHYKESNDISNFGTIQILTLIFITILIAITFFQENNKQLAMLRLLSIVAMGIAIPISKIVSDSSLLQFAKGLLPTHFNRSLFENTVHP